MAELTLQRYVRALFVGAFSLFVANKFVARPALESGQPPAALTVLTDSIPNFCEAVMGLTVVAGLLLWFRQRGTSWLRSIGPNGIVFLATGFAGAYVLTQEVGLHNLGGNNVFDPNDVVASLVGLGMTAGFFLKYGVLEAEESLEGRTGSTDA